MNTRCNRGRFRTTGSWWGLAALMASGACTQPVVCGPGLYYSSTLRVCISATQWAAENDGSFPDGYTPPDGELSEASAVDAADVTDVSPPPDVVAAVIDPSLAAPRAIAPLSTSTVTSQRPTLRWISPLGVDGALVELSRTRDFITIEQTLRATGDHARPAIALAMGVWFWRVRGRASTRNAEGTDASAAWWFRVGARSAEGDRDTSWGTELDVNGDGVSDPVVGAPKALGGLQGLAAVYSGGRSLSQSPTLTIEGTTEDEYFGRSMTSAGDVNGDGYADLIVGSPRAANGAMFAAGTVVIFYGSRTGLSSLRKTEIMGPAAGARFGYSVAGVGDINGDGFADIVAGAGGVPHVQYTGDRRPVSAHVYFGGAEGLSTTPAQTIEFGASNTEFVNVAAAGDFNGDGLADVSIGSQSTVAVYPGGARGLVMSSVVTLLDAAVPQGEAGDINGDGLADVLALRANNDVLVYWSIALSGSATPSLFLSTPVMIASPPIPMRSVIARGGADLNRDGFADIVVGAPTAQVSGRNGAGLVRVYRGGARGIDREPVRELLGERQDGYLGHGVSGRGDVNGDGIEDLLIGEPVVGAPRRLFVFPGSSSGPAADPAQTLTNDGVPLDGFGDTIARVDRGIRETRSRRTRT